MNEEKPMGGPFLPIGAVEAGSRGDVPGVAVALARAGFTVFPCRDAWGTYQAREKGKPVFNPDGSPKMEEGNAKTPLIPAWRKNASSDPKTVAEWWRFHPKAMVALPCGTEFGFWVLDADRAKNPGEADGLESLARLEAEHGPLPPTPWDETPTGGRHYYFRCTPDLEAVLVNKARVLPGIDIRCTGGYVIGPWSRNSDLGKTYALQSDPSLPLAEAPAWLIGLVRKAKEARSRSASDGERPPSAWSGPSTHASDWRGYAERDYSEIKNAVRTAKEHFRNDTLNDGAFHMFRLIVTEAVPESARDQIEAELGSAAETAGLGRSEIEGTLRSAWEGSHNLAKNPLTDQERRSQEWNRKWRRGEWTPDPHGGRGASNGRPGPCPPMDGLEFLRNAGPVVVVMSVEDARAFREDGVGAVALVDPANAGKLVLQARLSRRTAPLVFHESEAMRPLSAALFNSPEVPSVRGTLWPIGKTPAEVRAENPGMLRDAVEAVAQPWREAEISAYLAECSGDAWLTRFWRDVSAGAHVLPISTGFRRIDEALDETARLGEGGGMYPGLYILGATSSLGKTALCLQIADNIAESGHDILYFSLEMEIHELTGRSISRATRRLVEEKKFREALYEARTDYSDERIAVIEKAARNAKEYSRTVREITCGGLYSALSEDQKILTASASDWHSLHRFHRYYFGGFEANGVEWIRKGVARHVALMGRIPVVFVDYLQNLAPFDVRATDKQAIEHSVRELKRISRDFGAVVFCISSLNREGYSKAVTMEAFKESGGIEYTADVLLGMQYEGIDDGKKFDIEKARRGDRDGARSVELSVLKNRHGPTGALVPLKYYAKFNLFREGSL